MFLNKLFDRGQTWSIKPPSKLHLILRKLNGFWHKTVLKKIDLFKRYKQPTIDTELTVGSLANYNTRYFSSKHKQMLNKKHGRFVIKRDDLLDEVLSQLQKKGDGTDEK